MKKVLQIIIFLNLNSIHIDFVGIFSLYIIIPGKYQTFCMSQKAHKSTKGNIFYPASIILKGCIG